MNNSNNSLFLGLVSNQTAFIAGIVVFLVLGLLAFRRGKQTKRAEFTWIGLALMVFPYAVAQAWLLWLIGAGLTALLLFRWK
ncbi:hypothetical protein [Rhodoferax antarcticus]|uniref:Transmembrane domain protein n=1 Tax=Rhodoferax antarcticus ANT.BR TaxID=1111071 RepID=A0A1Q8YDT5_9BURK|nr:hypothetical protein [Rhodoferax antarcticus]APW46043.1 hypothetical protein RA876_06255 [Rhodoferax antarcticus]MCW2310391.1 hypothetical protein [Rhodoferax antarcticus]OLP06187.1 transmembrane domain protein [Rhodoferax antarcticus ANT.BR]